MEPEFQDAMCAWLTAEARERFGPAVPPEYKGYYDNDLAEILADALPASLCARISLLMSQVPRRNDGFGYYRDVWPLLTDEEQGVIMQAGAERFIVAAS